MPAYSRALGNETRLKIVGLFAVRGIMHVRHCGGAESTDIHSFALFPHARRSHRDNAPGRKESLLCIR